MEDAQENIKQRIREAAIKFNVNRKRVVPLSISEGFYGSGTYKRNKHRIDAGGDRSVLDGKSVSERK